MKRAGLFCAFFLLPAAFGFPAAAEGWDEAIAAYGFPAGHTPKDNP